MDRLTGAAQDVVSEESVMLVGKEMTVTTSEVVVCEGLVVTTPTPHPPRRTNNVRRWSELSGRR